MHHAGTRAGFDRMALRVNQAFIILFIVAGYILDLPALVVFVAVVMSAGTLVPAAALFQQFYRQVLRPAGLLKPDLHQEDPAPHRFAQGVGAAFLLAATVAFIAGAAGLGWALAAIVAVLAAVNLFFGFCAGCFVYFQLTRAGLIRSSVP